MAGLQPKPGFDWGRVAWRKPDSPRSAVCSYCFTAIGFDDVPLTLWKEDGYAAQFCDDCSRKWWGMERFPEPQAGRSAMTLKPDDIAWPPRGLRKLRSNRKSHMQQSHGTPGQSGAAGEIRRPRCAGRARQALSRRSATANLRQARASQPAHARRHRTGTRHRSSRNVHPGNAPCAAGVRP